MQITIHRGTKEIGGSCIEVKTEHARLVLDVGLPLVDSNRNQFDSRRALSKGVEELKATKVIPQVKGLFDESQPAPDAILLSHAHLDHAGLLHLSRKTVPIYATSGTSKMMLAASVFAGQKELAKSRSRNVVARRPFKVGDCIITPLAVDHSIFGSVAFLIEAEGKVLLYSGDFRKHGRKPGMINDLVSHAREKKIDALIVEGTHFGKSKDHNKTEYQLEEDVLELVRSAPGLVLATFSALDVDRIVTMYKAARKAGRVFVVDAYTAFVLYLIRSETKVPAFTWANGIRVFFNKTFNAHRFHKISEKINESRIELNEILAEPEKHLMVFRPSMTQHDFKGRLPDRCRCLYGYWEGYLGNKDWVRLREQIEQVRGDFLKAHVSGHAYVKDIISFVKSVQPRTVIPIHTFEPQTYRQHFPNTSLLEDGIPFELA